jgi:hypothetical protein
MKSLEPKLEFDHPRKYSVFSMPSNQQQKNYLVPKNQPAQQISVVIHVIIISNCMAKRMHTWRSQ